MGPGNIIIRRATADDAAGVVAFLVALEAERLSTIRSRIPPTEEEERELIEKGVANGRDFFLIAVSDEAVVGMLDLQAGEKNHVRHAARFGISVSNPWRRKGVGRQLVLAAIEETKAWPGFCRIELECAVHNVGALALYQSLGFQIEGRKRKSYDLGRGPEDMLVMALVW
jgi:putative acetyltransferase